MVTFDAQKRKQEDILPGGDCGARVPGTPPYRGSFQERRQWR